MCILYTVFNSKIVYKIWSTGGDGDMTHISLRRYTTELHIVERYTHMSAPFLNDDISIFVVLFIE